MQTWVIGNWKLHGSRSIVDGYLAELGQALAALGDWQPRVRVGMCPPFPYLAGAAAGAAGTGIAIGGQDVYFEGGGAYTGEVAAAMLADVGATLCIVGHSERRQLFGETDADVARKAAAVLEAGLTPIVCIGETLAEREAGRHETVVERQVSGALAGLDAAQVQRLALAYEPVWAIGTGVTATPEQADAMHRCIRELVAGRFGADEGAALPILYGGSVNAANAAELLSRPDINGALVGGASLKVETFLPIIEQPLR